MARQSGFTLLEMIVVLSIMGLLMAIAAPSFSGFARRMELRRSVTLLETDFKAARSHAMTTTTGAGVLFDLQRRQVRGVEGPAQTLPRGMALTVQTARSQVAGAHAGAVWFYPDGSSTGGRVTVADGRQRYWIDIDWITGRVTTSAR